jgi:glucose/arabinose dehydrogenase/PKD repeat protein
MSFLLAAAVSLVLTNVPPLTPMVTEPSFDGRITNPEDTHMETAPFSDPDPGDTHAATDWEIWTITPSQRIWAALNTVGGSRVHIHLGDGVFQGSHAGRVSLIAGTNYQLRVRHKDSSGDPSTQWSPYATRLFATGNLSTVFPLEMDDILDSPAPTWRDTTGLSAVLPTGATLTVESGTGGALLTFTGAGGTNQVTNPPTLPEHVPVRVRFTAANQTLTFPETDLDFTDHTGVDRTILLPPINTLPGQSSYFWVSANGSTYVGQANQTQPDFSILARGAAVPWEVLQPGYKVEIVASGFKLPVNIAFIPNPGPAPDAPIFYVTELYGAIKVVRRNGTVGTYAQGLLNFQPSGLFPGSGEVGLSGIVVDPASGDVFAAMLYDPNFGDDFFPKVVRLHSTDGGHTAATQVVIRDMVNEWQGQSHQISNLTIGPDGKLYVHMGDGFDFTTAQNLDSYRGKVLRMNLDGSAPSDNPFYNAANGITARDYIFAYGLRNPFGGAWRSADGKHYEVENGPGVDRIAKINAGQNYLWDGTDESMANFAIHNWQPPVGPVNMAFTQLSTFNGSQFPPSKMDHMFISESGSTWGTGPTPSGKRISEFVLNAAGTLVSGPDSLIEYNGSGKASCVGLTAGPDGLYFTDLYKDENYTSPTDAGANVLRVRFVGAASFIANITTGPAPLNVQFTDQSTVVSPVSWLWTFGDGTTSTLQNPSHVYSQDGIYSVRLAITGPSGTAAFQRTNYIKVGSIAKVAFIGSSIPPLSGDEAVGDFLTDQGLQVDFFDDEPANRPSAASLAASHDLVIVSSNVASSNIAGEFRTAAVPLLFWESLLLRPDREGLATSGTVSTGQNAINTIVNTHPITQGLPLGTQTVYQPGANMTVGLGPFGAGATVLARRGATTDASLIVAEQGATLLNGYITPARRAFIFLEDTSFLSTTAVAKDIIKRAACWAGSFNPVFTDHPDPVTVSAGQSASFTVALAGAGPMSYQWRRNGIPLTNGGPTSGATSATLVINPVAAINAGTYDIEVTAPCGTVTSLSAALSIGCYANCDESTQSPVLTANDFACFLIRYTAGAPYANCDGSTSAPILSANDFVCFLNAYAAGCP